MLFKRKNKEQKPSKSIHNLRTVNVIVDTFDLMKRIAYICELSIQIVYIAYLIVKICFNSGWLIGNVVLLAMAIMYFGYHLIATTRTFEEKDDELQAKLNRKRVKTVFRIFKRMTNLAIIVYAFIQLYVSKNLYSADTLFLVLMVIGFVVSIFCDIVIFLIDARVTMIKEAVAIDIIDFKEEHKHLGKIFDKFEATKDLETDEEKREKIEKVRDRVKEKHPHLFHKLVKKHDKNEVSETEK
ncbi:MAG: hypothetical protein K6F07_02185 [Bacilli bacterium]|nr:hypothetical protein [Bacilli bacterium]